ncbi:MAG: hypothetical protein GXO18_06960 [Aquificae bacterium]|nr:hypothetical protein [Aquificota bacterium]
MAEVKEDKELWQEVSELRKEVKEIREDIHRLDLKIEQVDKSLRDELHRLDKKFTVLILIAIFLIVFLNQNALMFILKLMRIMP